MRILDKFPIDGGQKDPKKRIIPFLPGDKHNVQHFDITVTFILDPSKSLQKVQEKFFSCMTDVCSSSYRLHSIAHHISFFYNNHHTPPRPNQFVVCQGSGRLAGICLIS